MVAACPMFLRSPIEKQSAGVDLNRSLDGEGMKTQSLGHWLKFWLGSSRSPAALSQSHALARLRLPACECPPGAHSCRHQMHAGRARGLLGFFPISFLAFARRITSWLGVLGGQPRCKHRPEEVASQMFLGCRALTSSGNGN